MFESFGNTAGNDDATPYQVKLAEGGQYTFQGQPSLLHALEQWQQPIAADCRAGECGTCRVNLLSGELRQTLKPLASLAPGQDLACCCSPASDITLTLAASGANLPAS